MGFNYQREPGREKQDRGLNRKEKPLVSIITAYYNAEKYFEQTYNCVLNQTFPWFEWIIVNDGSTDKIDRLEEFVNTDSRIILYHKENGGLSSARNYGIERSRTEYIVPLDADDLISEAYIEKLYFGLFFNPKASWAYTDSVGFQEQEYVWKKSFSSEIMKHSNLLVATAMIRKNDFKEVGYYEEIEKHYNEDWRAWLKLLAKGKYPVHVEGYDFWYRRLGDGLLSNIKSSKELTKKSEEIIQKASKEIKKEVKAVEFPVREVTNQFLAPQRVDWEYKTFAQKTKKKVLMLLPWLEMGGADLFNLEVVKKSNKEKYEYSIITTLASENTWKDRFQDYVPEIFELPQFLEMKNYAAFISYFIQSREIDVLFLSNSYYGYYLLPWLRKEFPELAIIDYVHMEEWYWRNGGFARVSGAMGEVLERTYVCNGRTQQILEEHFGREKGSVKTLYIGVDKEKFQREKVGQEEIEKLKKKFQLGERKVVLFPCRIHPQKRPFLLLEIAKEVKEAVFLVVGDGPQLEEMQKKVQDSGLGERIKFAGRAKDMRPYYALSNITLICSLKEGLALTAYESLAMGVPVVSSDVGGQKELITEEVGRIIALGQEEEKDLDNREFSKEEIREYTEAIKSLLTEAEEDGAKRRLACRKRIEEGFSTDNMIVNLERELEEGQTEERKRERKEKSEELRKYSKLVDEYVSLYSAYEAAEKLWDDVLWFKGLYEKEKNKKVRFFDNQKDYCLEAVSNVNSISSAEIRLQEIYSMRSWRMVEKYQRFMNNTAVGKVLSKIRDGIRGTK